MSGLTPRIAMASMVASSKREPKTKRMPRRRAWSAHDALFDHYNEVLAQLRAAGQQASALDAVLSALVRIVRAREEGS